MGLLPMLMLCGMIVITAVVAERHGESRALVFGLFVLLVIAGLARGFYWNIFGRGEGFFTLNRVSAAVVFIATFYATFGVALTGRYNAAGRASGIAPRRSPIDASARWNHVDEDD